MLQKVGFEGLCEVRANLQEAVAFLNCVKDANDDGVAVDTVFYATKLFGQKAPPILEVLAKKGSENDTKGLPSVAVSQKVVILSTLRLESYKQFILKQGAVDCLFLPLEETDFKSCC